MNIQSISQLKEYQEEKFTKRIIFKEGESTAFLLNFSPGQKLPPHKHPGSEVFLLVMNGSGTFTIDGKDTDVTVDDAIHCGGEEELAFHNSGTEPVSLYVVLSKIPNEAYAKNL